MSASEAVDKGAMGSCQRMASASHGVRWLEGRAAHSRNSSPYKWAGSL